MLKKKVELLSNSKIRQKYFVLSLAKRSTLEQPLKTKQVSNLMSSFITCLHRTYWSWTRWTRMGICNCSTRRTSILVALLHYSQCRFPNWQASGNMVTRRSRGFVNGIRELWRIWAVRSKSQESKLHMGQWSQRALRGQPRWYWFQLRRK